MLFVLALFCAAWPLDIFFCFFVTAHNILRYHTPDSLIMNCSGTATISTVLVASLGASLLHSSDEVSVRLDEKSDHSSTKDFGWPPVNGRQCTVVVIKRQVIHFPDNNARGPLVIIISSQNCEPDTSTGVRRCRSLLTVVKQPRCGCTNQHPNSNHHRSALTRCSACGINPSLVGGANNL